MGGEDFLSNPWDFVGVQSAVLNTPAVQGTGGASGGRRGGNGSENFFRAKPPEIAQLDEKTTCWAAALMIWIKSYGLQLKLGQGRDPENQRDLINFYAFSWDDATQKNIPRIAPDGKPYLFSDKSLNPAEADRVISEQTPGFEQFRPAADNVLTRKFVLDKLKTYGCLLVLNKLKSVPGFAHAYVVYGINKNQWTFMDPDGPWTITEVSLQGARIR